MKNNLGNRDRLFRISVASGLLILSMLQLIQGIWAGAAAIFSFGIIFTAWTGLCPLYRLFGISSHDRYDPKK